MKKLFIITGEYSGESHAANVVRELLKIRPDIQIEGVGGKSLEEAGVKIFANHDKMEKAGINFQIIKDHLSLGKRIVDYLKNEYKPDLVLLIDYGAFNLAISKYLKKAGIKTFYFIPPQVWASRKWRLKTIKKHIDKVLTIFPFEKEMYDKEGISAEFVGHPLVKELPPQADREDFFNRHGLDTNKKLVSIFPGSRVFEIKFLLDIFIKAAEILTQKDENIQIVFSNAPNLSEKVFGDKLKNYKVIKGENRALLSVSDALILASGTVALEAAFYKTPMIIAYKGPFFFYLIYLLVRSINKACLVNIITGKEYVEEFLMYKAKSDKIADKILKLLNNEDERNAQLKGLNEVQEMLTDKHCVEEVAKIIDKELNNG